MGCAGCHVDGLYAGEKCALGSQKNLGTSDRQKQTCCHPHGEIVVSWKGIIEEYRDFLPVTKKTPVVTLLEGNTPLIPSRDLSDETGLDVYLKYEGLNPTGSFKDRGMTMAISKAKEKGCKIVMCASTGNTSASADRKSTRP